MPLGMELGVCPGAFVLDGDTAPLPKRGGAPKFSAHVYCAQTAERITMPLGMEVGLSPGDFVFDGDIAPPTKKAEEPTPQFWPMSIVVKRLEGSRWHLARRWALVHRPGHIVLDGEPAPSPKKGTEPPIFGPFLLSPNSWMNQNGTWHGGGP